jgi:hypothetical protein
MLREVDVGGRYPYYVASHGRSATSRRWGRNGGEVAVLAEPHASHVSETCDDIKRLKTIEVKVKKVTEATPLFNSTW